ncbi:cadherin-like domain-containing protein, partial [Erythrobacter sp. sf7]
MNEDLGAFGGELGDAEMASQTSFSGLEPQASRQTAQVAPTANDNIVVLAEGQEIERFEADGPDLVIILTDGTRIVVPDGVIQVPQIVVGGTPIPPANVAALLVGNEPEPAAGPNPSSGGNFAVDPGDIQAAFDLGDLLPYTELPTALQVEEEVIPVPAGDEEVVIFGLDSEAPEVVLDEDDLADGSDGSDPVVAEGSFGVSAPDGLATVEVNGVSVVVGGSFAGPVEVANDGTYSVVITGWTPVSGRGGDSVVAATFSFRVTLLDNTLEHAELGEDSVLRVLNVTAEDTDGSFATASIDVQIVDDVPSASDDIDSIPAATFGPATGNVLTDSEGDGGADTPGADGITVTAAGTDSDNLTALSEGALTIDGTYGTLVLNADGSYSYTRNFNTPGGVTEVFTYRVSDGDGDTDTATLTITIDDAQDTITFVPETGDGTVVREPHLPSRDGEPAGSDFDGNNEATTGTITFESPDGVASVTIAGVVLTPDALPQTIVSDGTGTLVVTAYSYDPATGEGSITYTYTLNDNTLDPDGTEFPFDIVVVDLDGDVASDTVTISIIDDVPSAADDTDSLTEGGAVSASGNVITDAEANGDNGAD